METSTKIPFEPILLTCENPAGKAVTCYLDGNIIETTCSGIVGPRLMKDIVDMARKIFPVVQHPSWMVDLTRVTNAADREIAEQGKEFMTLFKNNNGNEFVFIINNLMLRLMIKAIGLATGLPLATYETKEEALIFLRK